MSTAIPLAECTGNVPSVTMEQIHTFVLHKSGQRQKKIKQTCFNHVLSSKVSGEWGEAYG
jgi:hypothetical protein